MQQMLAVGVLTSVFLWAAPARAAVPVHLLDTTLSAAGLVSSDSPDRSVGAGSGGDTFLRGGFFPALLSFFIPGLGQVLNGQIVKGIVVFGVSAILISLFAVPSLGALAAITWLVWWVCNIVDAATTSFFGFLPSGGGGGSDVGVISRDERLDLVVPVARPAI